MACYHPMQAWKTRAGKIALGEEPPPGGIWLPLPCGSCLGCETDKRRAWALRCHLEAASHVRTGFWTGTYDEEKLPEKHWDPRGNLNKRHLQLFLKRARKKLGTRRPIRFFASGEYGEQRGRPHYHAILYGADDRDADLLDAAWGHGHTRTDPLTPARIAYAAGYTAKKIGWKALAGEERVDYETGEIYNWQPPFIQMSRNPGIGGKAREFIQSWRTYAVYNGTRQPVPRFLHEAWKATASPEDIETLAQEKREAAYSRDNSPERREAAERIAVARQKAKGAQRPV